MNAADWVAIISAVSALAVAVIGALRGENVRTQLQQHVQAFHLGRHRGGPPSSGQ